MSKVLQQSICAALCSAAGGVQESLGDVPEIVDRSLSLVVGHARHDGSAMLELSTTHSANRESRWSRARSTVNGRRVPKDGTLRNSATTSPSATGS